jgi:sulfotransferase
MKSYYFISGLPRSGSTLLSSILKQNPEFYSDIASPVEALTGTAIDIMTGAESNFTITEEQRKNLAYGIFDGYYKHINRSVIFDSSRSWTRKTNFIKALFPYTKILCPVRDIVSILNSFEVILSKNCFYTKQINDQVFSQNIFIRINQLFQREIINYHSFLQEGYALNPEMIYFIEYENLCKDPERTIRSVYEFLDKPYYSHDFENLEYSNDNFDKVCNLKDLHTVRKTVEYNPPRNILPPEIVQKYKEMNMEFWRENYKLDVDVIKRFIDYT